MGPFYQLLGNQPQHQEQSTGVMNPRAKPELLAPIWTPVFSKLWSLLPSISFLFCWDWSRDIFFPFFFFLHSCDFLVYGDGHDDDLSHYQISSPKLSAEDRHQRLTLC